MHHNWTLPFAVLGLQERRQITVILDWHKSACAGVINSSSYLWVSASASATAGAGAAAAAFTCAAVELGVA
jgi:hypothetical protein